MRGKLNSLKEKKGGLGNDPAMKAAFALSSEEPKGVLYGIPPRVAKTVHGSRPNAGSGFQANDFQNSNLHANVDIDNIMSQNINSGKIQSK